MALPYNGGELHFLVLLPDERDGLAALTTRLPPEFPEKSADFDRMAPRRLPDDYLILKDVFHRTWLALDETRTEAVMRELSSPMPRREPKPIDVRVDRPFLFAVQHVASGATLFLGRVIDPR